MSRYRVLHVISSLAVGGAEVSLLSLAAKLRDVGFDNEIILLGNEDALKQRFLRLGIPVHQMGMARRAFPTIRQVVQLMRLGRALQPDLIQGWMAHGNLAAVLIRLALIRSVPLFWSVHQSLSHYGAQPLSTRFSIKALSLLSWIPRRIIYVSRVSREEHRAMGFRNTNAIHIPNGVDVSVFYSDAVRRAKARAQFGLPASARVIGHVGRYHPTKDQPTLLSALRLLLLEDQHACAVLIGHGLTEDNPNLNPWIGDSRLAGRLQLLGPRSDIAELLPGFDIFCLSSVSEACSMAILEAMSSELRCVVTDVGDSAWMLGGTGAVVPPGDPPALASALRRLLEVSPEAAATASKRARARVLQVFSQGRMIERYRRLYQAAIEGTAASTS